MKTEYYDNYHMKTNEKDKHCVVCHKPTDRLNVLTEEYICSEECDRKHNEILNYYMEGQVNDK